MNYRRIIASALFLILLCISPMTDFKVKALTRQTFITVKVNGQCLNSDAQPYMKENRTYVPIRFVGEALGMTVNWTEEENKLLLENGTDQIQLTVDSSEITVNGEGKAMEGAVEKADDRIMVPLRFVAENLGCSVEWDQSTYSVLISKEGVVVPEGCVANRGYSDEDLLWLSRIIHVEGKDMSIDGKVAVANVILNRIISPKFPDTVYDVIFDKKYSVQFPPAHKPGFSELKPSEDCIIAAKMALEGINNIENCLFFCGAPMKNYGDRFYKKIDSVYFYK